MRYKKSAISARQIVDAAIRVLAQKGYARASLNDIAQEAGMSKGALHYHFATKEALIDAVLETACTAVQQRTIAAWTTGANPLEALHNSLVELWGTRAKRTDEALVVADLLAQSLYNDRMRPRLAKYYDLAARQLGDYLTEHLYSLGVRPRVPAEMLPRMVIGLLDGLVLQSFVAPEVLDADAVVRALETLALSLFDLSPVHRDSGVVPSAEQAERA